MKKTNTFYQQGIAHLFLIIAGMVILLGAVGYVGYTQFTANQVKQVKLKEEEEAAKKAQEELAAREQKQITAEQKPSEAQPSAPGCSRNETRYVTASVGLSVRSEKSSSSQALIVAPYGNAMTVGCLEGEWYSAEYGGKTGYALAPYLSATKPTTQPNPQAATPRNPTQANCLPNDGKFTVYASVASGTPTYWDYSFTKLSGTVIPFRTAMTVHCFDNNIQRLVHSTGDSFVKASEVTTTKP